MSGRARFGLVGILLVGAIAFTGCGGGSKATTPGGGGGNGGGGNGGGNGGNGTSLTAGLSSNLDALTSYQFKVSVVSGTSSGDSGGADWTGTIVNKPTKAMLLKQGSDAQYIVVGDQMWLSSDGQQWTQMPDASGSDMFETFLPAKLYGTWWDGFSSDYKAAGSEKKNGVDCTHFKGDDSLGAVYAHVAGASAELKADLWVAKSGAYPVSGLVSWKISAGGKSGQMVYSFDVTNVNDPANKVEAPAAPAE